MSAHRFKTNQTRLILTGFAYVLMPQLRLLARQKLVKIGARVTTSVRRITISMPDACPVQAIFFAAWRCRNPIPSPARANRLALRASKRQLCSLAGNILPMVVVGGLMSFCAFCPGPGGGWEPENSRRISEPRARFRRFSGLKFFS